MIYTTHGQNVTIRGQAHPSYAGAVIGLYSYADFITGFTQFESNDTIAADGSFEIPFYAEHTQPVLLKTGNVSGRLYVQPDFVYGITVPETDPSQVVNDDVLLSLNIGVLGHDSSELNALIFDYEAQYNSIFGKAAERHLSRAQLIHMCDSLQKHCEKRYARISNPYFKTYLLYQIASINASLSRGENFLLKNYIYGKPVQYQHEGYMQLFKGLFNGYLAQSAAQRKGQSLYNIINTKGDYDLLLNFMRYDKEIRSDTIRELIMLVELWTYYFSKDFEPEAVARVISGLHDKTKIGEHRKVSSAMLAYIHRLQQGSPAPGFQVMARDGKILDWTAYKGRWVYINFFSTENVESLRQMPKIAALKRKFGDKVVFLSICLDDSLAGYREYLKKNPRFDWLICYDHKKLAKKAYSVTGTENYVLVNNFGLIAAAPALSPSQGIEYRFNIIFRNRTRNTKTGIR